VCNHSVEGFAKLLMFPQVSITTEGSESPASMQNVIRRC